MDTNKSKSNMKRASEDNGGQLSKLQRIEPSDEPVDETTKITDLIDDCLVKIFSHLDIQSLFNVAIANEWLKPAANDAYKRKFGAKWIEISGCDDYRPKTRAFALGQHVAYGDRALKIQNDLVKVRGLKVALQYLRCFGVSIKNLKICYNQSKSERYNRVHQYINKYCIESLVRLSFDEMPNLAIKQFESIYANVTKVNCDIECGSVQMVHQSNTESFQNLKNLSIYRCKAAFKTTVNEILRIIQRITSVKMEVNRAPNVPFKTLLDMVIENSQLTELMATTHFDFYSHPWIGPVNSAEMQRLANEHPRLVKLDFKSYRFAADDAIALIRQLKSLKYFRFHMEQSKYSEVMARLNGGAEWEASKFDDYQKGLTCVTLKRINKEKIRKSLQIETLIYACQK